MIKNIHLVMYKNYLISQNKRTINRIAHLESMQDKVLYLKNMNEKRQLKTVTFKDTVIIYDVESYKEHNKKFCFNEEEGLAEFYKEFPSEYNSRLFSKYSDKNNFNRYFGGFRNPNVTRRNVDPECCCNIM